MTTETVSVPISGAEARRAARNAGAIAAASLLSRGLQFGWQLILVPGLGPAAYGVYGAVLAFVQVGTSIPAFGMGMIVIRDVARHPDRAGKYLTATMVMQTVLALLAYIGVNAAAALGGYSLEVRAFVAIAGLNLIIDILGNMCNDLLLAREQMLTTSAVTIAHIIVLIGLAGLGLASGYGLFGVYIGTTVAGILRTTALWVLAFRAGIRPVWPLDKVLARGLFLNGAPMALSSFLGLAYQHVDKLVTNRVIGDKETGFLTVAFIIIFGVVELLNTTILTALYPLMSRAYGDGKNDLFGFMVEKLSFFTLVLCTPITLVISFFAAPLTVPLFGEDFRPAASVLSVLIWYALIMMAGNMFAQGLLVQNRQRRVLLIRASGLGVNLVLLIMLLPIMGVVGAAVASVGAEIVVLGLYLYNFRAAGWDIKRVAPRVGRLIIVGVVSALAMLFLGGVHPIIGIIGGLLVYIAGVLVLNVPAADDWDLLYRLLAALPGGGLIRKYWRREVTVNW